LNENIKYAKLLKQFYSSLVSEKIDSLDNVHGLGTKHGYFDQYFFL